MADFRRQRGLADGDVVERGDIWFFYRPRVGTDAAQGVADIQRFFMIMKPEGRRMFRLAVIGRKRLPQVEGHERVWGFVDMVTPSWREIEDELAEHRYRTLTRGERDVPSARPAGEGGYALVEIDRGLHLTYELELPERPGAVQRELNIAPEAAFVLSIKNPEKPAPPGAGLREQDEARYPGALQREFRGRRFDTFDPRLLDFEGAQFILVGARKNPERAYGIDVEAEHGGAGKADLVRRLERSGRVGPVEPLTGGQWR